VTASLPKRSVTTAHQSALCRSSCCPEPVRRVGEGGAVANGQWLAERMRADDFDNPYTSVYELVMPLQDLGSSE
jgi:hypothetical protein